MNYSDSIYRQQDSIYRLQNYQTINVYRDNYDNYSIYSTEQENSEQENSEALNNYESELRYTNSIYSDINEKNNEKKNEQLKEKEEKVISDIISFYTNEPVISELIPLPISPENLEKLKNQWNKEDKFSMKINEKEKQKEKTVWKRISDSFKKQSSPKRSLYDILTK